jgi:hypothetical protein
MDATVSKQPDEDGPKGIRYAHPEMIKKSVSHRETHNPLERSQLARIRTDTSLSKIDMSCDI